MGDKQKEEINRSQLENLTNDKVESLLVQATDWGVNIRIFLNGDPYELDPISNWDGYKITLIDDSDRDTVKLDKLVDLVSVLRVS